MTERVLINGGGAGEGGGGTYILAVARELARAGTRGLRWRFLVSDRLARQLIGVPLEVSTLPHIGPARRIIWEQLALARSGDEKLIAAAGFGPLVRRDSYLLVAHNQLYYSGYELRGRRGLRLRLEGVLGRAATRRAHTVVVPTVAMGKLVAQRTGRQPHCLPFGPGLAERRLPAPDQRFTFLHRTHWGPHKRLEDLLLAVRELAQALRGRFVVVTGCDPRTAFARSFPESRLHRHLIDEPLVREHLEFVTFPLGSRDQTELAGDAVVMPSTRESFSFPIAEGLCFGLPVIAADCELARELCGNAGLLFPPHDWRALAAAMERLVEGETPPAPSAASLAQLSWRRHVDELVALCCTSVPSVGESASERVE